MASSADPAIGTLSRRRFLQLAAATVAGTAAAPYLVEARPAAMKVAAQSVSAGERVVPTCCNWNCGAGPCVLRAHVVDGVITRFETDVSPDDLRHPQVRACTKARSYRKFIYHPDRLKYPMKRVGERGSGQYQRISWDEAIETIARELKRVIRDYGNEAIYDLSRSAGYGQLHDTGTWADKFINAIGGATGRRGGYSKESAMYAGGYTFGRQGNFANDRMDLLNSRLIISWGGNPANEARRGSLTAYYLAEARRRNIEIIYINPHLGSMGVMANKWISIYPGTDTALGAAMAYVIYTRGLHDQAFLDRFCIGFDEAHLPQGAPPGSSFVSYILGRSDGQPKTPEWAERITGVPARDIEELAIKYATQKPATILAGNGAQRRIHGEQFHRMTITLAAMTGNIGVSGGSCGGQDYLESVPREWRFGSGPDTGENPCKTVVLGSEWGRMLLNEEAAIDVPPGSNFFHYPSRPIPRVKNRCRIAIMWGGNIANQESNTPLNLEALRTVPEFSFAVNLFMNPTVSMADIILPACSRFERSDLEYGESWLLASNQCIEPLWECKTDREIATLLAEAMGIDRSEFDPKTEDEWLREMYSVSQVSTIMSYEEFREKGIYFVELPRPRVVWEEEIKQGKPFPSPSGKIEIYSERLAAMKQPTIPPIPQYVEEASRKDRRYPLAIMGTHTDKFVHSMYTNSPWNRDLEPHTLKMNPVDADARGIRDGMVVEVFNDWGTILIPVQLTNRVRPGVVIMDQGVWYQPHPTLKDRNGRPVDIGGCINTVTPPEATLVAIGGAAVHSTYVEVRPFQQNA